jgi:hypothetical protein
MLELKENISIKQTEHLQKILKLKELEAKLVSVAEEIEDRRNEAEDLREVAFNLKQEFMEWKTFSTNCH